MAKDKVALGGIIVPASSPAGDGEGADLTPPNRPLTNSAIDIKRRLEGEIYEERLWYFSHSQLASPRYDRYFQISRDRRLAGGST